MVGDSNILGAVEPEYRSNLTHNLNEKQPLITDNGEKLEEFEISSMAKEIIESVMEYLPDFLRGYGLKKYVPIGQNNFHLVNADDFAKKFPEAKADVIGRWDSKRQAVILFVNKESAVEDNPTFFLIISSHEIMHAQSFSSLDIKESVDTKESDSLDLAGFTLTYEDGSTSFAKARLRRIGLSIIGKKNQDYFYGLNEAVTQELTERFSLKLLSENSGLESLAISEDKIKTDSGFIYSKNRQKLWQIVDEILDKNNDKFGDREEVFKVFTQAYFDGNIVPLAKLIEGTYGKGAFRRLGEETQNAVMK